MDSSLSIVEQLVRLNNRMMTACDQISCLEQNIDDHVVRHDRAVKINQRSSSYQLRLKLTTLQAIQDVYVQYADSKVEETLQFEEQFTMDSVKKHIEEEVMKVAEQTLTCDQHQQMNTNMKAQEHVPVRQDTSALRTLSYTSTFKDTTDISKYK